MTYELAKKLKEAGFPQEGNGQWWGTIDKPNPIRISRSRQEEMKMYGYEDVWMSIPRENLVYFPILSELIEACGDWFTKLWKEETFNKKWFATGNVMPGFIDEGSTPEEAVANLWLALQDKK